MQADKVDLYIMTNNKTFPANQITFIREKLLDMDETQFLTFQSADFKNPTTMLIISILVGGFGIDRFMLKQTLMGVIKLLTGGLFGILTILDWITIMDKTRTYNMNLFVSMLQDIGVYIPDSETVALSEHKSATATAAGANLNTAAIQAQAVQTAQAAKANVQRGLNSAKQAASTLADKAKTTISDMSNSEMKKATSVAEQLKTYKELLDQGILTQEEFDAKKNEILNESKH